MGAYSQGLRIALGVAAGEASNLGATEIDPEDLLLGVLKLLDLTAASSATPPGVAEDDWAQVRTEAAALTPRLRAASVDLTRTRRTLRKVVRHGRPPAGEFSGHRSTRSRSAFELAAVRAQTHGASEVGLTELCWAILTEPSDLLSQAFGDVGLEVAAVRDSLEDGARPVAPEGSEKADPDAAATPTVTGPATPLLRELGRDLTDLARRGELHPILGRDAEIRKLAQIISKKGKPNAILIGEAGTGKTAVVEGLALQLCRPDINPRLAPLHLIELSMASLVAGTVHRGEFEARLEGVVREASSDPHLVLFIDEIHTMVGAGSASGQEAMDAGNILKPALARGDIRVIGATTTEEYRRYIEPQAPLARRFETVRIEEPTEEVAVAILEGLAPGYAEHYGIEIPQEVLRRTVELTVRYLPSRRLPDKAISTLDEACVTRLLGTIHVRDTAAHSGGTLTVEDIAGVIASSTGIPVQQLTGDDRTSLLDLEDRLRERVLGQEHALHTVAEAIRAARSGFRDPERATPVATLLFVGATGTGKTELAKALAEALYHDERHLLAFDMSNYQQEHKVSELVGSPPGYVGSEREGLLAERVRTYPSSVVLFDEIEKAHRDVLQVLLPVLDEGRLTDNHGRSVSFRDTVIIFTSNLGSDVRTAKPAPGFRPVTG
jgi:ATP-dependent Clp protease ATP-binding subunit ClpC